MTINIIRERKFLISYNNTNKLSCKNLANFIFPLIFVLRMEFLKRNFCIVLLFLLVVRVPTNCVVNITAQLFSNIFLQNHRLVFQIPENKLYYNYVLVISKRIFGNSKYHNIYYHFKTINYYIFP